MASRPRSTVLRGVLVAALVVAALVVIVATHALPTRPQSGPAGFSHAGVSARSGQSTPAVTSPQTGARQAAADAAAAYAREQGWATGIAIVDTSTGQATLAGDATGYFPAESTVKVLLAAHLLASGQMDGEVALWSSAMITASDDDAADAIYDLTAGDDIALWASQHYGIAHLGTEPLNGSGQWGSIQVTPVGMAQFLAAAVADPTVGPWLVATMGQIEAFAVDGTAQDFGLRSADPLASVKQGWGGDVPDMDATTTPSVGYVDGGRYAVALYTLHAPATSHEEATEMVSAQARLLMPDGHIPPW